MLFKNMRKKKIEIDYRIPQIDEGYEGLKKSKDSFRKSQIGSPLFGSQVKDTIVVPDIAKEVDLDVRKGYDAFRSKKLITDEELIKKYGTKYYEFQMIDNNTRREVLGDDVSPLKSNKQDDKQEEPISGFSFIQNKDDFVTDGMVSVDEDIETNNEVTFDFGTDGLDFEDVKPADNNVYRGASDDTDYQFGSFKPKMEAPKKSYADNRGDHTTIVRNQTRTNDMPTPTFPETDYHDEEPIASVDEYANDEHVNINNSVDMPKVVNPYQGYTFPPKDIFKVSDLSNREIPEWVEEKKETINRTLADFDIAGEVVKYTVGPTFTRYEVLLSQGVNVKKIANLNDTFQMNLGATSIRILAPIPGKKTVGFEVPNDAKEVVYFGDVLNQDFYESKKPLLVALGKDIDGNSILADIETMPHGLVGGATNSGKSVCINTMLISLLLKNTPNDLKLILIDPKQVELISYSDLPHLLTPVISDPEMASEALRWCCEEMERRYSFFRDNRVRNIKELNDLASTNPAILHMSRIVIVIDELADLIMVCSSDVEDSIKRLTQKARAAGIHLIVATQRPTVDVVKGTIKANIPTRIAFKVVTQVDSSTILDESGAETLLGRGDMLFKGMSAPIRLQGAYITDEEIDAVTGHIRNQLPPEYLFTHEDLKKKDGNSFGSTSSNQESPEMLYDAACFFLEVNSCSVNSLQQRFSLGFNRAQRIVTALEEMGIVSGKALKNSSKPREVLVTKEELDRIFEKGESY